MVLRYSLFFPCHPMRSKCLCLGVSAWCPGVYGSCLDSVKGHLADVWEGMISYKLKTVEYISQYSSNAVSPSVLPWPNMGQMAISDFWRVPGVNFKLGCSFLHQMPCIPSLQSRVKWRSQIQKWPIIDMAYHCGYKSTTNPHATSNKPWIIKYIFRKTYKA